MINIIDKQNCCGCSACVQICPKECISFDEDEKGFRYPEVDKEKCIACGLCETVCPVINVNAPRFPLKAFAAINLNDKVRMNSSSGGIFTMLAESVIAEGGVVFGAKFDTNWEVVHDYTECKEELESFRGSKYLQSRMENAYRQTYEFLKNGRKVLFSGTFCQIAGLKKYLRKDYDNLLTVDIVCHGVPSPKLWREYLLFVTNNMKCHNISFKDKSSGWRTYSFTIKLKNNDFSEVANRNKFMMSYLRNFNIRPSCFNCPAKDGKSGSDVTLGDYWGIEKINPQMDDGKGTSFVCANTENGLSLLKSCSCKLSQTNYEQSLPYNPCINQSTLKPESYDKFWNEYNERGIKVIFDLSDCKDSIFRRIIKKIF